MALITPVSAARAANLLAATAAAAGGDEWTNNGKDLLLIEHTNGAGDPVTLTIITQTTVDGEPVDDKEISIPAGERHLLGPFPAGIYNDGDGHVQLTYDDHTDIEIAVIRP